MDLLDVAEEADVLIRTIPRRVQDSTGKSLLKDPCADIKCGEYDCPQPFTMEKLNGGCCDVQMTPPLEAHSVAFILQKTP